MLGNHRKQPAISAMLYHYMAYELKCVLTLGLLTIINTGSVGGYLNAANSS